MSLRHVFAALAVVPVLALPATAAQAAPADPQPTVLPQKTHFDLQAHRGGIGMTTEESLEGFGKAMRLGVTTLELDTHVTKDQKVVVNHDRQISAQKCKDTAPVTPGDPMYPYVGKYIKDLTLAQIKTMDCGYQQLPGFPQQEQIKGHRMVELKDVLNLVKSYNARQVKLNIETKVEAGAPEQTAPRELFVRRVYEEIHASGIEDQVTIQSFDWGALKEMHKLAPKYPLVALTNYDFLQVGKPAPRRGSGASTPTTTTATSSRPQPPSPA
ncbi:putative glycerophosphoryl diester phosphodiesterase precursor (GlpQ) [Streptomyces canarius]